MQLATLKNITMTSREIAELVEKQHNHVLRDIRDIIEAVKDDPNLVHQLNQGLTEHKDGRGYTSHFELNRFAAELLVTGYDIARRARVISRLQELEENQAPALPNFSNPAEAARAWAEQYEKAEVVQQQLERAKPKIQHYDAIVDRQGLLNATQVAQKVRMSAVTLNKHLDELGVYNKAVKRGRTFKQSFIDQGLGIIRQVEGGYSQALFTLKGEAWVVDKLISEGVYTPSNENNDAGGDYGSY